MDNFFSVGNHNLYIPINTARVEHQDSIATNSTSHNDNNELEPQQLVNQLKVEVVDY